MFLRVENLSQKRLIGISKTMSLSNNKTVELWQSFMPRRNELANRLNSDFISMQVYAASYNFKNFDFTATFEKWAVAEVSCFDNVPEGMKKFTLPSGLYAVFLHKGAASEAEKTFRYIFESWIPASGHAIDHRPHFEILGEKYKTNDPSSEEEIWIPITKRLLS